MYLRFVLYSFNLLFFLLPLSVLNAQEEVPILRSVVDATGRIQIEVNSTEDKYYILYNRSNLESPQEFFSSMTLGEEGTTTLTEPLSAYNEEHYRVVAFDKSNPGDVDGDGIDDIVEYDNIGRLAPLNPVSPIHLSNGYSCIPTREVFEELSYQGLDVLIDTHLNDLEYVKFYILDANTDSPKVYFMNTVRYRAHHFFADAIGIPRARNPGLDVNNPVQMRGEIVYHPFVATPNGGTGLYRFEFEPNDSYGFEAVRMGYELLAANMPFLENNWSYFPMPNAALPKYYKEKELYDESRIAITFEDDIYEDVDYIPFNQTEGYGLLREMDLDDRPNSRDVVLYDALPNEMPRVAGIITTVPQTPLSHVNLRAIQDRVPNAYIRNATSNENIKSLIDKYVYFNVGQNNYTIREANINEVNAFYDAIRPKEPQAPIRDLSIDKITPLDDISFEQSTSFGVKAANVATMRKFGFEEYVIPDGYGIPFYYYDEFMKYNNFYEEIRSIIEAPAFKSDFDLQDAQLSDFRKKIKDAPLPEWMYEELGVMQASFPEGTSIRCRSSTNNEDLPGFSGAGLYTSKTQHPEEGHIEKSVKQVFASLWNFRAFDEREFYLIDHFQAAMGILVHPNFSDEEANGVGVSTDPIYLTEETFYINTQIGEDLVTNPEALSIPEEILLSTTLTGDQGYSVVRASNQTSDDNLVMEVVHLDELRANLQVIHDEFEILYEAEDQERFAMEIEYKITKDNELSIKQARPWLFSDRLDTDIATTQGQSGQAISIFPNPTNAFIIIKNDGLDRYNIRIYDMDGKAVLRLDDKQISTLDLSDFASGTYFLEIVNISSGDHYMEKIVLVK